MSDVQLIVLVDVCRVCLSSGPEMSDLFASTYKHSATLSALFTKCTSLALDPDDGGPQLICAGCLSRLIVAHEFREQCFATNESLRRLCAPLVDSAEDSGMNNINNINLKVEIIEDRKLTLNISKSQNFQCDSNVKCKFDSNFSDEEDNLPLNQLPSKNEKRSDLTNYPINLAVDNKINQSIDQTPANTFPCPICLKTFTRKSLLAQHHTKQHDDLDDDLKLQNDKPHKCPTCPKGFQQPGTLRDHIRTHSGEAPFLCSQCGKSFNNGSNLRQHVQRHTGVKPYKCDQCPMRFTCKGGLKSHLSIHSGHKPFSCDVCGSSFSKTYSLVKHKRIHTGERPYQCEMCEMRFNDSDHVKRHMRTHTGEKPYKCNFCERAFTQSNDLVKHKRSHLGDKTYMCQQCPAAFRLHSELRAHNIQHYALIMESSASA